MTRRRDLGRDLKRRRKDWLTLLTVSEFGEDIRTYVKIRRRPSKVSG